MGTGAMVITIVLTGLALTISAWLTICMINMINVWCIAMIAVLTNHVYAYPVPSNASYLWCMGLTLMLIFVLRIVTGVILVTEPMAGVCHILVHMILSNMGRIAPGLHAIGSTMVMAVMLVHMLR
jgi:quinol-cytochrome oxidoreductase complex cytochrome b subunit